VVPTPADTSLVGGFFAAGESALTHIPWTFSSLLISSAGPPTVAPDQQTVDSIHENGNEWKKCSRKRGHFTAIFLCAEDREKCLGAEICRAGPNAGPRKKASLCHGCGAAETAIMPANR
jgi:hypothetical protein